MDKVLKNKKIMIPVGVVIIICVIYIVLCIMAGSSDFVVNTSINGIDVGHMTKEEAITALNNKYNEDAQNYIDVNVNDKTYQIDMSDNMVFDAQASVDEVSSKVKGHFFTRGYYYLTHRDFVAPVSVKDENVLKESINKSEILTYDTTVATTYELSDNKIIFTKGQDGQKVSEESLINQINDSLENYSFKDAIECELVDNHLADGEMETLHTELCQEVKNATLDKKNDYAIVDSQVGIDYSLEDASQAFSKAKAGETFEVSATITQPTISKEDLEKNLFKDVLGTYTTTVSGSSVRKNNVRLAGVKAQTILLPGEEFSFNQTVGQRTVARGFGAAGAYRDGETVDEVGGGVCQTSSTLYNAVLLANLEITLRTNHSYVSSYVPIGRDATVSWGGPDFKFKNNRDYPIKIVASYSGSRLTMKIVGTDVDGSYVKITSERLSSTPYSTKYVDDATLEAGKEVVQTSGYTGAKAQSYRYVYDKNGKLISSSKEAYSNYKKRDKVVKRGTKVVETPQVPQTETPQTQTPSTTQPTTPQTNTTQVTQ